MARRRKSGLIGVNKLNRKLRRMGPAVKKGLGPALQTVADAVHADALKRIPVREGDLAAALKKQVLPKGTSARVGYWQKGNKKNWELGGWRAHFIEFGTLNSPAIPFIRPAFRENIAFARKTIDKAVDKVLKKVARGG